MVSQKGRRAELSEPEEMLLMFPEAPADLLFWDFIDVVGNETAPKSIYLGALAVSLRTSTRMMIA